MYSNVRVCMQSASKTAIRLALTYIFFGALWILFSDQALERVIDDAAALSRLQTVKGWFFVAATGLIFFVMARAALLRERSLTERDALTQLLNRHMFRRELDNELRLAVQGGEHLALLHINLDGFRQINNSSGHAVGDHLLQLTANLLREMFETRAVIGRIAGDEFSVSLRDIDWDQELVPLIAELTEAIKSIRLPDHPAVGLSASVGAAHFPIDGLHSKSLMAAAALALDEAKQSGMGQFRLYNQDYGDDVHSRLQLLLDFKEAIVADALSVVYQPQFNARTRRLSGVEVLVRWTRDNGQSVRPDVFIPLAEQQGIIGDVTRLVCRQAVMELTELDLLGTVVPRLSLNLSAHDVMSTSALSEFVDWIKSTGINPAWVQIEITETAVMQDLESSLASLHALRDEGFLISVDDFGTGYSSLSMLRRLPVQELKIDQSFISDIPHSDSDQTIVRTIIAMARALGLRVVAEGVETAQQAEFLVAHSCDELQGYYLGRPMPLTELQDFLKQHEPLLSTP